MLNKKILMLLSLTATFNLSCASTAGQEIADDLLGVDQSPVGPTNTKNFDSDNVPKWEGGYKHRNWQYRSGIQDPTPDEIECLDKRMSKKRKHEGSIRKKKPSWYESFNSLQQRIYSLPQWIYSFIYSQEPDQKADNTVVPSNPLIDDNVGASTGTGVTTSSGPTAKFTSGVDLLSGMTFDPSMVYNQLDINCCTTTVLAFIVKYYSVVNSTQPQNFTLSNPNLLNPSRLFMYYNAKWIANKLGATDADKNDAAKSKAVTLSAEQSLISLDQYGVCPENQDAIKVTVTGDVTSLPVGQDFSKNSYTIPVHFAFDQSNVTVQPSIGTYYISGNTFNIFGNNAIAVSNPYASISQNIRYDMLGKRDATTNNIFVPDPALFKSALSNKKPIFLGLRLFSPFLDQANYTATGTKQFFVPMPTDLISSKPQTYQGGHAVTIVGWGNYNPANRSKNYYKILNSWGSSWGDCGFCYLPEEYIKGITTIDTSNYQVVSSSSTNTARFYNVVSAYSVNLPK